MFAFCNLFLTPGILFRVLRVGFSKSCNMAKVKCFFDAPTSDKATGRSRINRTCVISLRRALGSGGCSRCLGLFENFPCGTYFERSVTSKRLIIPHKNLTWRKIIQTRAANVNEERVLFTSSCVKTK